MKSLIFSIIAGLTVSSCDFGNFESVLVTPHYSIFYSEDFARRFSLPVEKAVGLNNAHLKAVAIGIDNINRDYECNIHFYYDDAIKLYSPNNKSVFFHKTYAEWFFVKQANDLDLQFNYKNTSNNTSPALFRSKSAAITQTGTAATIGYSRYKEQIFLNLNLVALDIDCHFLDSRHGGAEVWIKKMGVENYELVQENPLNIKRKENNYRFDVPLALLQTVKPMIDRINALPVDSASSNISVQYGAKE